MAETSGINNNLQKVTAHPYTTKFIMNIKTQYKSMVSYSMHDRKSGNRGGNGHGYMKRMARRELRRNGKQFVKEGLEFRSSDCLK